MSQAYINRPEDAARVKSFYDRLNTYDNQTLVDAYNIEKRVVGVNAQTLYLIAMHHAFVERFGKSPIIVTDDTPVKLTGPIYYIDKLETFDWFNKN